MATATVPVSVSDAELKLFQTLVYPEGGMHVDERGIHFMPERLQRPGEAGDVTTVAVTHRTGGLPVPAPLLRPIRRPIPCKDDGQRACPFRLPQSKDRVPAAAQRSDLLPQRHDLLRRS